MQKTWSNQNVDLSIITQRIIQFFEEKKFDITALETEKGYQIIAGASPYYKMESYTSVLIEGKPEDFSVNLEPCNQEKTFKLPAMLTTMFGGGYFLLKHLRSDEVWMTFSRDFWRRVDSIIMNLKGTANSSPKQKT